MIKKVAIDARMVGPIPHGIARYVTEICQGLRQVQVKQNLSYEPIFIVGPSTHAQLFAPFSTYTASAPFLSFKELYELPSVLKSIQADLYHSTSFSSLWTSPCKHVMTLHDLNHLTYGNWKQKLYYKRLLKRFALKAEKILTVSKFSRKEISDWLQLPEEKIEVIYNSVGFLNHLSSESLEVRNSTDSLLRKYNLTQKQYFYTLSNSKPHKNLKLLIQAYLKYREKNSSTSWPLILTIDPFPDLPQDLPGVQFIGHLDESDAKNLLFQSGGMFFPSLYEGFGLPPLEAALAGVPLAVSQIPPHVEGLIDLSSNEALWIDPNDLGAWSGAFQNIQEGKISPASAESRRKISERYSSYRLGESIDQVYQAVLNSEK